MDKHTFNQSLHQWAAMYAQAETKAEEDYAFKEVLKIVREMQTQNILKPIIFYQIMMTLQALTCVAGIQFTEVKVKKILAIIYRENEYVTDLTKQVLSAVNNADHMARENPENEPMLEQLRQQHQPVSQTSHQTPQQTGPPPGPIS
jgi:hypothetical protein